MLEIIAVASSLLALFSFGTFILSLFAIIEVQAFKKSTHQVEYIPMDVKDALDENWATSEETLNEDLKQYKEDMRKDPSMSFFVEDDKEIRSF